MAGFPRLEPGFAAAGDRDCAEGRPRHGSGVVGSGPWPWGVPSTRLLTEKPRLRLVVRLWEQVTVPGFSES